MAVRNTQTNDGVVLVLDGAFFELLEHQSDLPFEVKTDGSRLVIVPQKTSNKDDTVLQMG